MENENMNELYRIAWQSKLTNFRGNGEFCFDSRELALETVKRYNEKFPFIKHWVERNPAFPLPKDIKIEDVKYLAL